MWIYFTKWKVCKPYAKMEMLLRWVGWTLTLTNMKCLYKLHGFYDVLNLTNPVKSGMLFTENHKYLINLFSLNNPLLFKKARSWNGPNLLMFQVYLYKVKSKN